MRIDPKRIAIKTFGDGSVDRFRDRGDEDDSDSEKTIAELRADDDKAFLALHKAYVRGSDGQLHPGKLYMRPRDRYGDK